MLFVVGCSLRFETAGEVVGRLTLGTEISLGTDASEVPFYKILRSQKLIKSFLLTSVCDRQFLNFSAHGANQHLFMLNLLPLHVSLRNQFGGIVDTIVVLLILDNKTPRAFRKLFVLKSNNDSSTMAFQI